MRSRSPGDYVQPGILTQARDQAPASVARAKGGPGDSDSPRRERRARDQAAPVTTAAWGWGYPLGPTTGAVRARARDKET